MDGGKIFIGDRDVTDVAPKRRDIAMVFQSYALYPHMTVAQNLGFALRVKRLPRAEVKQRVQEAARLLELEPYLDRRPRALSGGQRQRVAMGRAIVREPQVFCMDEPLSNLDAKLRVSTRTQIASLQRRLGVTTVYVTHDQVEAMTMGDRVAVLHDGVLQHRHPIAHRHRLDLIVGDIHGGHAEPALQRRDLGARRHPQLGVEVGQRLVHAEHLRLAHDRPAHRHPLALAARERPWPPVEVRL